MGGWKRQKMEMEEKMNAKMLELTIEYKERRLVDWRTIVQKDCQELKNKEEAWNETEQQYQKTMIDYKHKKDGWEREKEL
jgi:hypothetical protein